MREAELWARLYRHLGQNYAAVWADTIVLADLAGRTVNEALRDGLACKQIWRAVWLALELPFHER